MSPWFWLATWVFGLMASVAIHEAAHVAVALKRGWTYHGIYVKLKIAGVGVKLEPQGNERYIREIALAGPTATVVMAAIFGALGQLDGAAGTVFTSLMFLNIVIAAINLLPFRGLDGGYVVFGTKQRREMPKVAKIALVLFWAWIAFESLATVYFLFVNFL